MSIYVHLDAARTTERDNYYLTVKTDGYVNRRRFKITLIMLYMSILHPRFSAEPLHMKTPFTGFL